MKENILDNYALNRLTSTEKVLLKKALDTEPGFQQELDFHKEIVQGIEVHMESLFDAALVDVLIYADQALKDTINQVDTTLEIENFFQDKKTITSSPIVEPVLIPIQPATKEPVLQNSQSAELEKQLISELPSVLVEQKEDSPVVPSDNLPTPSPTNTITNFAVAKYLVAIVIILLLLILASYLF